MLSIYQLFRGKLADIEIVGNAVNVVLASEILALKSVSLSHVKDPSKASQGRSSSFIVALTLTATLHR